MESMMNDSARGDFTSTEPYTTIGHTSEEDIHAGEYSIAFRAAVAAVLLLEEGGGLLCNLLVLLVFHLHRQQNNALQDPSVKANSGGQQAEGSNAFIRNLTVVDVLLCVTALPLTLVLVLGSRSQDALFCFFHEATVSFSSCASASSLLIISLDRYESIVTPFKTRSSVHRKWRTLGAVWLASLGGFCCPFLALALSDGATFTYTDAPQHLPCFMWVEDPTGRRVYFELYYVFVYLVANIVMVICYMKIFRLAKHRISVRMMVRKTSALGQSAEAKTDRRFGIRSNSAGSIRERGDGGGSIENVMGGEAVAGGSSDYTNPQGSKKLTVEPIQKLHDRTLTKMTLIIVSTFMVCWGPHACTSVAIMLRGTTVVVEEIQLCCLALAYSTTILHPLIYTFMRRTFRRNLVVRLQRKLSRRDFGLPSAARVHPLPPSATAQVAATSRAPLTKLSPVPSVSDHSDHLDNSGASKLNYVSFSKDSGIGS